MKVCRGTSDENLARTCRSELRALLTFDVGFADLRAYPPEEYAGFIVLRLSSQSRARLCVCCRASSKS